MTPNVACEIAREFSTEFFHDHIVDSIVLDATLRKFLNSTYGHLAVRGSLKNAQGGLATYPHSPSGANLLVENIQHWFDQCDFVSELLCAALNDRRVLSIFTPTVSEIVRQ